MFICPGCFRQYLIGEGWIPPPCIFKSSSTIRELPEEKKCMFSHIECQCGQHIGVLVISGPQKNIGYWRMQFDCQETQSQKKDDFQLAKCNFTKTQLKHIYQVELTNQLYKTLDVQFQIKNKIHMGQRILNKHNKKPRTSSL